jgi:hypothetical protein
MINFYVPYVYGIRSRSKTILHKGSFLILFLLPVFLFCFSAAADMNFGRFAISFICAFTSMYCVYEIGYLYNDVITTKNEKMPSYWLPQKEQDYVEKKFQLLVASRVLIVCACLVALSLLQINNLEIFEVALVLLYLIFTVHNSIRNKWNVVTNFGLQCLKYCCVTLPFCNKENLIVYMVIMIIQVPLIRSIEFLAKKRMGITFMQKMDISLLRVVYHLIISIVMISLFIMSREHIYVAAMSVSIILLTFRIISYILLKNKKVQQIRYQNFTNVK